MADGPKVHEIRRGDQVRVVQADPETGEEESWVGLVVLFKPDDAPGALAVPLGDGADVERFLLEASYSAMQQRRWAEEQARQRMMEMQMLAQRGVSRVPGQMTPGGVATLPGFVPGPPSRKSRKQ